MTTKKMWLGLLVIALVFIACGEGGSGGGNGDDGTGTGQGTGPGLNGTWVLDDGTTFAGIYEITFNNGNWEFAYNTTGLKDSKGTYTTNAGKMTFTTTHI